MGYSAGAQLVHEGVVPPAHDHEPSPEVLRTSAELPTAPGAEHVNA